jgi:DNA polymerase III epsilon subunit-like protein
MTEVDIVLDFETTGFQATHVPTQLAAVAVDVATRAFISQGELRVFLTPDQIRAMSPQAQLVNGWTPDANLIAEPLEVCVAKFRAWCATFQVRRYVAHNAPFDRRFAHKDGWVDTAAEWGCTKEGLIYAENRGLVKCNNHKLETLEWACQYQVPNKHVMGPNGSPIHVAIFDALGCANGWNWLQASGVSIHDMRAK